VCVCVCVYVCVCVRGGGWVGRYVVWVGQYVVRAYVHVCVIPLHLDYRVYAAKG